MPRRLMPTVGSMCRSTPESWRPAWPASATASSSSTTPAPSGPAPASGSRSGLFPTAFCTAASRTAQCALFDRRSRRRTTSRRRHRQGPRRAGHGPIAARRGPRLLDHTPGQRARRHARVRRGARRSRAAARADSAGDPAGRRVEMHLRDLKTPAGTTVKLSVQAVDAAGNLGPSAVLDVKVSSFAPVPLPQPARNHARGDSFGPPGPGRGCDHRRAG